VPGERLGERGVRTLLVVLSALPMVALGWARLRLQLPQGDEPHYLVISRALLDHGSLDVQRVYAAREYWDFFPQPLEPHVAPGPEGRPLPLHAIGGPVLWLLPFALGGRPGVLAFMVAVSLLIVDEVYGLVRQLDVDRWTGFTVALAFAVGTPILTYSSLSFVEPIGALACIVALRVLHRAQLRTRDLMVASVGLGVLPWVHGRFLLFPPVFLTFLLVRVLREPAPGRCARALATVGPAGLLLAGLVAYHAVVWHSASLAPNQVNAGAVPFRTSPWPALLGTALDQEAGVIPNFPIFLLVLPGLLLAGWRRHRALHLHLLAVVVPYLLLVCSFPAWAGAWSPPARFAAVVLPMLAGYVAVTVARLRGLAGVAMAAGAAVVGAGLSVVAVLLPDGGFSAQRGASPVLAFLDALTGSSLIDLVPSSARDGQPVLFAAWLVAAAGFAVAVRLLARPTRSDGRP
jgi:hypothetical protein